METKTHWEEVYTANPVTEVSWFQEHSDLSLRLIEGPGVAQTGRIIDVGGGASTLVDDLLEHRFQDITVLDISAAALRTTQERLGPRASEVAWLEADITTAHLPRHSYDVWHARAVFHFLTRAEDRQRYVRAVGHSVKPGGHVIVATFAADGPRRCSGLETMRYSPASLHSEFGDGFELVESASEAHHTPSALSSSSSTATVASRPQTM